MPATFVLRTAAGSAYPVETSLRIGREASCSITLPGDPLVSRFHATVWVEQGKLYVRDENASNGVLVNGRRLAPAQASLVRSGDEIQIGETRFSVVTLPAPTELEADTEALVVASPTCRGCGEVLGTAKHFCTNCGAPIAEVAAPAPTASPPPLPPAPAASPPPLPAPAASPPPLATAPPMQPPPRAASATVRGGFSVWWLIVPTVTYAFLSRDVLKIILLTGIGLGLRWAQGRSELPATVRPYLPLLQPIAVFFFLGGNPLVLAVVSVAAIGMMLQHRLLIRALEPWWQVQASLPAAARRLLAIGLTLLVGYYFGRQASGQEWTMSFLSIAVGTIVTLLLVFRPPAALRRPEPRP